MDIIAFIIGANVVGVVFLGFFLLLALMFGGSGNRS
jgi:hypothetical protein